MSEKQWDLSVRIRADFPAEDASGKEIATALLELLVGELYNGKKVMLLAASPNGWVSVTTELIAHRVDYE